MVSLIPILSTGLMIPLVKFKTLLVLLNDIESQLVLTDPFTSVVGAFMDVMNVVNKLYYQDKDIQRHYHFTSGQLAGVPNILQRN